MASAGNSPALTPVESPRSFDKPAARPVQRAGPAATSAPWLLYAIIGALLLVISAASLLTGQGSLGDTGLRWTLLGLRGTRLCSALLVGAALAASGLVIQGLFRNPLADTSVLGTAGGAALGGNLALIGVELVFAGQMPWGLPPDLVLPAGCLAGALLSLTILLALLHGPGDSLRVLLTGVLLSSLFLSLSSLATSLSQERWELGRAVISFVLGSLTGNGPRQISLATPLICLGLVAVWCWGPALDVLLSGETEAASLGVDVVALRRYAVLWVSALTAGAVALGGNIAFVGLLIPHAARRFLGASHQKLVPATALGGAVFVAACDLLTRLLPGRGEVPLGVVTGLIGAPVFLFLLARTQREAAHG